MVLPAFERGNYHYHKGVNIGQRLGLPRRHLIDALVWRDDGETYLVSSKWQQSSGTAEQKVPFEVMCLLAAINGGAGSFPSVDCTHCQVRYEPSSENSVGSYLVLGGSGWTLREFYTHGGLVGFMPESARIKIVTLEDFVAMANTGRLSRN
jgi:hypothetical protein